MPPTQSLNPENKSIPQLPEQLALNTETLFLSYDPTETEGQRYRQVLFSSLVRDIQDNTTLGSEFDLYVNPGGNNSNSGLEAGEPLQTIDAAVQFLVNRRARGDIHLADGNYTSEGIVVITGNQPITLIGNVTTPANVIISGINCEAPVKLELGGITLTNNLLDTPLIKLSNGAKVKASGIVYGATAPTAKGAVEAHGAGTTYTLGSDNTLTASVPSLYYFAKQAQLETKSFKDLFTGTPNFSVAFLVLKQKALADFSANTSAYAAATGIKYHISGGSLAVVNDTVSNFFPGDTPGVKLTGGQLINQNDLDSNQ